MRRIYSQFQGTGVALITPFNSSGDVDFDRLALHADRLINNGVNYLVALGTTAETPTLTKQEKDDIIQCVIDANGKRVPVVAGAGGNNTAEVVETVRLLNAKKIDGLLSVAPYYNKPNQNGLYQHFSAIAAVAELPLILYNVPGRTGSNISADTVLRLASDYDGLIVAIKEASGDFNQIMNIIAEAPGDFMIISGDDAIALPMISCGGKGVISVIGNAYPAQFSGMIAAALEGAYDKARELHFKLLPMMQAIFKEGNPTGVKAAIEIQGLIDNVLRLPLIPASQKLYEEIKSLDARIKNN